MARRKSRDQIDEGTVLREIATRKIEAERVRVRQLTEENEKLRNMAGELQRKISVATARVAELEKKLRQSISAKEKEFERDLKEERNALKAELKNLKETHKIQLQQEKDRWEKKLADLDARHAKEVDRLQQMGQREVEKIAGEHDSAEQQLADLQEELEQERHARQEAEQRLNGLEQTAKRIGVRSGQITGFEVDSPEELMEVLGEVDPDEPLGVLRSSVRELRGAAGQVERAFARALKTDDARTELQEAGASFAEARMLPDTDQMPPASAMLVDEAFTIVSEEVADRIKGRHYSALISAMAGELVRVLRNQREDMSRMQRLVEIAEGTELATAARLLLKGATSHQQEIAAARLVSNELKQVQREAREHKGKVKKLYAVAETGMAGEWAVEAIQALAALKPLPRPEKEVANRPMYRRVIESGKLVQERVDSAMNLGADAEAALRESDEAFSGLEGMVQNTQELLVAARRELMSKVEGEKDARLKIDAARQALADVGKRGKRAVAIFDEQMKGLDMLLNQWKATYKAYSSLSRDVDRIESSIDGSMLDIAQPLESEEGKRLFQIIHDLSEHLPEYRSLAIMRQRLFFHLENPKQRIWELKEVVEQADRIIRAMGEPSPSDHTANYQLNMARLYHMWAYLEEVRGGTHSQLAVAAEQIEPVMSEVMTWVSSTNINNLTDSEVDDVFYTTAYVRRLKQGVLTIHDLAQQEDGSHDIVTAQFEQRLENVKFPPEWDHVVARLEHLGANPPN